MRSPVLIPQDTLSSLTLLIGEIRGELSSHIAAVVQDRAERESDRAESAQYRKEVRQTLSDLNDKLASLDTHAARLKELEGTAEDYRRVRNRVAGAVFVIAFFWSLALVYVKDYIGAVAKKVL